MGDPSYWVFLCARRCLLPSYLRMGGQDGTVVTGEGYIPTPALLLPGSASRRKGDVSENMGIGPGVALPAGHTSGLPLEMRRLLSGSGRPYMVTSIAGCDSSMPQSRRRKLPIPTGAPTPPPLTCLS